MVELLTGKVFLIVTGASQGIGQKIAITLSKLLENGSRVLLLARNENGLKETAGKIPSHVSVECVGVDLCVATADQLTGILEKSVVDPSKYDRAVIIHNAASIGDLSKMTTDMLDFDIWRKYYDLNVFSPAILNGVFMKIFCNDVIKKLVINITSLCGVAPHKSMAYYCSGKAAREMFFKVFAEEFPHVNVLNYSPGPVETEMLRTLAETSGDAEVKQTIVGMRKEKKQLTTNETVDRLVEVLKKQKYKSGGHVDYFDEI